VLGSTLASSKRVGEQKEEEDTEMAEKKRWLMEQMSRRKRRRGVKYEQDEAEHGKM
jgi:hypothetical protein